MPLARVCGFSRKENSPAHQCHGVAPQALRTEELLVDPSALPALPHDHPAHRCARGRDRDRLARVRACNKRRANAVVGSQARLASEGSSEVHARPLRRRVRRATGLLARGVCKVDAGSSIVLSFGASPRAAHKFRIWIASTSRFHMHGRLT